MILSLLIPLRGRAAQAKAVIPRLVKTLSQQPVECEIIVVESANKRSHDDLCRDFDIRYSFDCSTQAFHKTRLLNIALSMAQGKIVVPYDIDLVPSRDTAFRHLEFAISYPKLLITGFRLMCSQELPTNDLEEMRLTGSLGPENGPSAVLKWLVGGERFGVVPHFQKEILINIGGWDESYIGWGAEDQDIIERYLASGIHLMASPDLVYLHLHHPPDPSWTEDHYRVANLRHYRSVRATHD